MLNAFVCEGVRTPIGRYGGALSSVRPDDAAHVNPNGGAIGLGHPLGMSGARLVLNASIELRNKSLRNALCAMCVGVGQSVSLLLESP